MGWALSLIYSVFLMGVLSVCLPRVHLAHQLSHVVGHKQCIKYENAVTKLLMNLIRHKRRILYAEGNEVSTVATGCLLRLRLASFPFPPIGSVVVRVCDLVRPRHLLSLRRYILRERLPHDVVDPLGAREL
jgi:hypothetical protein